MPVRLEAGEQRTDVVLLEVTGRVEVFGESIAGSRQLGKGAIRLHG